MIKGNWLIGDLSFIQQHMKLNLTMNQDSKTVKLGEKAVILSSINDLQLYSGSIQMADDGALV